MYTYLVSALDSDSKRDPLVVSFSLFVRMRRALRCRGNVTLQWMSVGGAPMNLQTAVSRDQRPSHVV